MFTFTRLDANRYRLGTYTADGRAPDTARIRASVPCPGPGRVFQTVRGPDELSNVNTKMDINILYRHLYQQYRVWTSGTLGLKGPYTGVGDISPSLELI